MAYQSLLKKLEPSFLNLRAKAPYEFQKELYELQVTGDIATLLGFDQTGNLKETSFRWKSKTPPRALRATKGNYSDPNPKARPIQAYEVSDKTLPKMVMFRDSFADALIPFLAEHFERSVFVGSLGFEKEIITKEKPDIVITELCERYVTFLGKDDVV